MHIVNVATIPMRWSLTTKPTGPTAPIGPHLALELDADACRRLVPGLPIDLHGQGGSGCQLQAPALGQTYCP